MKRYYSQLLMMKNRFPMESGEPVSVPFGWNDRSDVPNCVTYDDVNYELCCVLFNISAGHATLAMNETRSTEDVSNIEFITKLISKFLVNKKCFYAFSMCSLAFTTIEG